MRAPTMLTVSAHPLLDLQAFITEFPRPLAELPSPPALLAGLALEYEAPLHSDDHVRTAVRDLLRSGGFKPTGRSKPASEYLLKAAAEGLAGINAGVDACNVASLHSGLPISVVDLERVTMPLRIEVAAPGSSYVFNRSGQTIDIGGLLVLSDAEGPCAGPVKDSQRSKTGPETTRTLSLVWGSVALPGRAARTADWYRALLHSLGATTTAL
jgi:DNA/RNA-binding domain of Phe-tRNA-synthetase-like protein